MTTEIPASIITPDQVKTRLGTLRFFDGFPDDEKESSSIRTLRLISGSGRLRQRVMRRIGCRRFLARAGSRFSACLGHLNHGSTRPGSLEKLSY